MKMIDDWKQAHHFGSIQLAGAGFVLSSIGTGIAAAMSAANLHNVLPDWAGWAFGCVICVAVTMGRILVRKTKFDDTDEAGA